MEKLVLTVLEYAQLLRVQLLQDMRTLVRDEVTQAIQATTTEGESDKEQLLTIAEAAKLLDVCPQTIHSWKARGLFVFNKLGNRTYIKKGDLFTALQSQKRSFKRAR